MKLLDKLVMDWINEQMGRGRTIESAPVSHGAPLYPSVWIKPMGRFKWLLTAIPEAGVEFCAEVWGDPKPLLEAWREDMASGSGELTCEECVGEGKSSCGNCEGTGRGVVSMTWDGEQVIGDCPRVKECPSCEGKGKKRRAARGES